MIDVAVADYGTPQLAAECVGSLAKSRLIQSVQLVDAKARGWSYARSINETVATGSAPYVLALNADTLMLHEQQAIIDLFESDERIAIIGPRQRSGPGAFAAITHAGVFGSNQRLEHRLWNAPFRAHVQETADTRDAVTVSGSVLFARRSAWEELGGFLDTPMFYEETFLCFKARHRGHRVVYTGATTWIHYHARSPNVPRAELAARSRELFRAACAAEGIECE